jgi:hypothetical protein
MNDTDPSFALKAFLVERGKLAAVVRAASLSATSAMAARAVKTLKVLKAA